MVKPFIRRPVAWTLLACLLVLVFAFSACGDSGSSSTNATPTTASSTTVPPTTQPTVASGATITIQEQTGGQDVYSFAPASVTIKVGETITFNNQSDEFHQLIMTDAAGKPLADMSPFTATSIVPTSRVGNATTLQVVFNKAGTYHYTSKLVNRLKDGAHPEGAMSQGKGTIIVN